MSPPSHDDRPPGADASAQGEGALHEDVSAYLDGDLSDAEIEAFEAELDRNATLREELDDVRWVSEWLADEGPLEAPMGFANRVMDRIEAEHPTPGPWWTWLRRPFGLPLEGVVLALAAAVVLLLVLPSAEKVEPTVDVSERPARQARVEAEVVEPPPEIATFDDAATNVGYDDEIREKKPSALPQTSSKRIRKSVEPVVAEPAPSAPVAKGTGDLGLVESITLPTNPEHVPSPSEVGTPIAQAPYTRPDATTRSRGLPTSTPEEAVEQARFRPYAVSSDDPAMLARVLKLAARFGGAMDDHGQAVQDATLGEDARDVYVRVPHDALPDFVSQLEALGYRVNIPTEGPLLASDTVIVRLRVQLSPAPAVQ